jgi:DNA-binding CsgD family transcriptional regulator
MFGQAQVAEEHGMVGVDLRTSSAELAVASGRWDEARRLIAEARAIADEVSSSTTSIRLGLVEADLAAWEGRWSDGLAAIDRALETMAAEDRATFAPRLAATGGRLLSEMAAIARAGRNSAVAADLARRADGYRSLIEEVPPHGTPPADDIPANRAFRLLAVAELSRLDGGSDRDAWVAAADAFTAMTSPYPIAYCRFRETEARLTDRESRLAASAPIVEAEDIARRLGAGPLLQEIEALRLRARLPADPGRVSRRPPTPRPAHGLTPREVEVVGLVAEGQTNRQIAGALFITEKTAGLHVSNILTKLGVSNRVEAAAAARRLQLLPGDGEPRADS